MSADSTRRPRTQVLVVGAGPVGLMAALQLREQGVDVRVIDQQSELRAHVFPVILHPLSLRILSTLGLSEALHWRGRPVSQLAIYTEFERRAVLSLPGATGVSPGALTLPQDVLRQALLSALAERGVAVEWDTRLALLQQDERSARGWLVHGRELASNSDPLREQLGAFEADFVIGADGYDSVVRSILGIDLTQHGPLQTFAFFDATTQRAGTEAQLTVSAEAANSVYPLQGGLARFSFQLVRSLDVTLDLDSLQRLIADRMPWYGPAVESCEWSGVAEFRSALASRFGVGRVWLAGEAAHLTGPLGVQSINVGLDEASELSLRISDALRSPSRAALGDGYQQARQLQWRQLLGLEERASLGARSPSWVWRNLNRLLPCMPASGSDLDDLFEQLRLTTAQAPGPGGTGSTGMHER